MRPLHRRLVGALAVIGLLPASACVPGPPAAEWVMDFRDDFDGPLSQSWGAYGWGRQAPTDGAMGLYKVDNVYTAGGNLVLRTWFRDGEWTSAGVSSGPGFAAVGGKWEFRARFGRAKGIGYAMLLWPDDHTWPPEVDILEGRVNGPRVMTAYHWGPDNRAERRFRDVPRMDEWHTYGVIVERDRITSTLDGEPWATIDLAEPLTTRMWIGFQTGAMDPNGMARDYETVPGGVPNPETPPVSTIEIDWVTHHRRP